jgi:hypothetical protein
MSKSNRLTQEDQDILQAYQINVIGGEDIFRFYLSPDIITDLPKITANVLKVNLQFLTH